MPIQTIDFDQMTYHDSSGKKLNASDELSKSIVSQSKEKRRKTKRYIENQEYLQKTEESVQDSAQYINKSPGPVHHKIFVRDNSEIKQHTRCDVDKVYLGACESESSPQILIPSRIADLQNIVNIDKGQRLPYGSGANRCPNLLALLFRGSNW